MQISNENHIGWWRTELEKLEKKFVWEKGVKVVLNSEKVRKMKSQGMGNNRRRWWKGKVREGALERVKYFFVCKVVVNWNIIFKFDFFFLKQYKIIKISQMNHNFNGLFPFVSNSNFNLPNYIQSGNYAIFPIQSLPLLNNLNNFYCPPENAISPPPTTSTVKKEFAQHQQEPDPLPTEKTKQVGENQKNKEINKVREQVIEEYCRPPPQIKHKVRYYDPSNAPLVTSGKYFLIQKEDSKKVKIKRKRKQEKIENNELDEGQSDSQPFIVFRDRRKKKKYRRYFNNSAAFIPFLQDEVQYPVTQVQSGSFGPGIERNMSGKFDDDVGKEENEEDQFKSVEKQEEAPSPSSKNE